MRKAIKRDTFKKDDVIGDLFKKKGIILRGFPKDIKAFKKSFKTDPEKSLFSFKKMEFEFGQKGNFVIGMQPEGKGDLKKLFAINRNIANRVLNAKSVIEAIEAGKSDYGDDLLFSRVSYYDENKARKANLKIKGAYPGNNVDDNFVYMRDVSHLKGSVYSIPDQDKYVDYVDSGISYYTKKDIINALLSGPGSTESYLSVTGVKKDGYPYENKYSIGKTLSKAEWLQVLNYRAKHGASDRIEKLNTLVHAYPYEYKLKDFKSIIAADPVTFVRQYETSKLAPVSKLPLKEFQYPQYQTRAIPKPMVKYALNKIKSAIKLRRAYVEPNTLFSDKIYRPFIEKHTNAIFNTFSPGSVGDTTDYSFKTLYHLYKLNPYKAVPGIIRKLASLDDDSRISLFVRKDSYLLSRNYKDPYTPEEKKYFNLISNDMKRRFANTRRFNTFFIRNNYGWREKDAVKTLFRMWGFPKEIIAHNKYMLGLFGKYLPIEVIKSEVRKNPMTIAYIRKGKNVPRNKAYQIEKIREKTFNKMMQYKERALPFSSMLTGIKILETMPRSTFKVSAIKALDTTRQAAKERVIDASTEEELAHTIMRSILNRPKEFSAEEALGIFSGLKEEKQFSQMFIKYATRTNDKEYSQLVNELDDMQRNNKISKSTHEQLVTELVLRRPNLFNKKKYINAIFSHDPELKNLLNKMNDTEYEKAFGKAFTIGEDKKITYMPNMFSKDEDIDLPVPKEVHSKLSKYAPVSIKYDSFTDIQQRLLNPKDVLASTGFEAVALDKPKYTTVISDYNLHKLMNRMNRLNLSTATVKDISDSRLKNVSVINNFIYDYMKNKPFTVEDIKNFDTILKYEKPGFKYGTKKAMISFKDKNKPKFEFVKKSVDFMDDEADSERYEYAEYLMGQAEERGDRRLEELYDAYIDLSWNFSDESILTNLKNQGYNKSDAKSLLDYLKYHRKYKMRNIIEKQKSDAPKVPYGYKLGFTKRSGMNTMYGSKVLWDSEKKLFYFMETAKVGDLDKIYDIDYNKLRSSNFLGNIHPGGIPITRNDSDEEIKQKDIVVAWIAAKPATSKFKEMDTDFSYSQQRDELEKKGLLDTDTMKVVELQSDLDLLGFPKSALIDAEQKTLEDFEKFVDKRTKAKNIEIVSYHGGGDAPGLYFDMPKKLGYEPIYDEKERELPENPDDNVEIEPENIPENEAQDLKRRQIGVRKSLEKDKRRMVYASPTMIQRK